MPEREKVIDYLAWAIAEAELTGHTSISLEPLKDALALLKEQEPLIRCADCRYYEKRCPSEDIGWCNRPGAGCGQPEDFFCAAAERKEDGDAE